LSVVILMKP